MLTGYETYTSAEREAMIADFTKHIREEQINAEGDGLRAEVARANVRSFVAAINQIRATKALADALTANQ